MVIGIDPSITSLGISDGVRHQVVKTQPDNSLSQAEDVRRRVAIIGEAVQTFAAEAMRDKPSPHLIVIEGPMLNPKQAGHLYELGFLMSELYERLQYPYADQIIEVQPSGLKKFLLKGNLPKDQVPDTIYERWGVRFEKDAGADKAHAFIAYKYGEALLAQEIIHTPSARRGSKRKARKKQQPSAQPSKRLARSKRTPERGRTAKQ